MIKTYEFTLKKAANYVIVHKGKCKTPEGQYSKYKVAYKTYQHEDIYFPVMEQPLSQRQNIPLFIGEYFCRISSKYLDTTAKASDIFF
jgi:hypothetical protein